MKKTFLFFGLWMSLLTSIVMAQDVNSIFKGKLTFDPDMSSNTKATVSLMKAMMGDMKVALETKVYRYAGSFEDAINNIDAPSDTNITGVSDQIHAATLSMYLMMTENLNPKPMGNDWHQKAASKAKEFGEQSGKLWTMRIGESAMENPSNLFPGSKVSIRTITVASPYFDTDNLQLVEGTWVSEAVATIVVTEEMMAEISGGFEDEWDEEEIDMDIDLPPGAHFVSFDDVANTDMMQGEVNYVIEMSVDQVTGFYKNYKKRHCTIEDKAMMFNEDDKEIEITYMICLKHNGEVKEGDDVVHLTILEAPKDLLSDALGKNQGTWILICINRWIEESP